MLVRWTGVGIPPEGIRKEGIRTQGIRKQKIPRYTDQGIRIKNTFLILTWTVESLRVVPEAHTNISSNQHNQHNNQQSGGQSVTQYNHAGQLISQLVIQSVSATLAGTLTH